LSLKNEQAFAQVQSLLRLVPVKAAMVILVWALSHHVLAGVRHLLSDFDIGSPLNLARRSAWVVNLAGIALAVLATTVLL
jgi:succinate dehydrogenase / fumarate reductase cytochrome b subunit